MRHPLVLVSGVPGTGKSTYGGWLQRHHGFRHFDIEQGDFGGIRELSEAWWVVSRTLPPPPVGAFVRALKNLRRPVVLDWGYPPIYLPLVKGLHERGITAWWFDGDRSAARKIFIRRGTVSVSLLNAQMGRIEANWPAISAFYEERVIDAVQADGAFTDWNTVYSVMF